MANLLKITGLWKNQAKNGDTYITGRIADTKIVIFKNNFKEKDNQPDYLLNIDLDTYKSLDNDLRNIIASKNVSNDNKKADDKSQSDNLPF